MCTDSYKGNNCFFVVKSSCVQTTEHSNTRSTVYLFAKGSKFAGKMLA
jgi:hypothetical protein